MRDTLRPWLAEALRSRPALLLIAGRTIGFVAAFAIPIVLARLFDQSDFGTYKQLFLIYSTLFGLAQLGLAESLYYFVPKNPTEAGRHASNAVVTLALVGLACVALLGLTARGIAGWMMNPELAQNLPLLAAFLALMLVSAPFEIVLISRKRYVAAASTYAASDVVRTLFMVLPAIAFGGVRWVLLGAILFAALRLSGMLVSFWREFKATFRPDLSLWQYQLAYALPFALAVGVEVVQANFHQYVVASQFDAATFAIFAVGCLQIPLVDVIANSSANVMMVKMADGGFDDRGSDALALWHHTICRLALVMFPLTVLLLLTARDIIVTLFTSSYLTSVPIFMLSTLTILPSVFCVDAVLRVHAQTRVLLGLNLLRLGVIATLIGWFLSVFGLAGAVLVTLLSTALVRVIGIARIAVLMRVGIIDALPWRRLTQLAVFALVAAVPAIWVGQVVSWPRVVAMLCVAAIYGVTYGLLCVGRSFREYAGRILLFGPGGSTPLDVARGALSASRRARRDRPYATSSQTTSS